MSQPSPTKYVRGVLDDRHYSPDLSDLYIHKWHPLFVYGTLKQGYSRNLLLSGSIYVGPAFTRSTGWALYHNKHKFPFPVAFPVTEKLGEPLPPAGGIMGELYFVSPNVIQQLDFIEGNGIMYQRIHRLVDLFDKGTGKPSLVCTSYMYIGIHAHWKHELKEGKLTLCSRYTKKKNPDYSYYAFTRKIQHQCAALYATTLKKPVANF
jgi:gamma-glutamylcyclotransferase (GGCT)/AIG2-like uncharacterized protein YtfP